MKGYEYILRNSSLEIYAILSLCKQSRVYLLKPRKYRSVAQCAQEHSEHRMK